MSHAAPYGESETRRSGPVARKVKASTAGAAVASVLLAVLTLVLGDVPEPVAALVIAIVPPIVTFVSGYSTHKANVD